MVLLLTHLACGVLTCAFICIGLRLQASISRPLCTESVWIHLPAISDDDDDELVSNNLAASTTSTQSPPSPPVRTSSTKLKRWRLFGGRARTVQEDTVQRMELSIREPQMLEDENSAW
ncbi:hypothetical protein C8R45DRAFT_941802 [Mycena sanguinolenta]|nr:hypothetical protein C8R45DRAFT_941802 [Mycena sanguinolenta]